MKTIAYNITGTGKICAVIGNESFTVESDHKNYTDALEALRNKDADSFIRLVDISEYLDGKININGGAIEYNGFVVHNSLTERIFDFMNRNYPVEPLIAFFNNLMQNPSNRAVNEFYDFLEIGELPITEDGHFLAFKNVRADYFDIHTGTYDNHIGEKPSMPRNMVDENKDKTCSKGLHFCSIAYLPHFSDSNGGHTMIVKINPRDVVSIPADYNNTKGRCCLYEVVGEYGDGWRTKLTEGSSGWDNTLYSSDGGEYVPPVPSEEEIADAYDDEVVYGVKPSGIRYYAKRDEKGRFFSKKAKLPHYFDPEDDDSGDEGDDNGW